MRIFIERFSIEILVKRNIICLLAKVPFSQRRRGGVRLPVPMTASLVVKEGDE